MAVSTTPPPIEDAETAREALEKHRQAEIEETAFEAPIPAHLPGTGEPADDCGYWFPREFCDASAHLELAMHRCGRRECPRCWSAQWAAPRTKSAVSRLSAARWAEPDGPGRRVLHATISPPEGEITDVTAMYQARSRATELAKKHGIRGGVTIVHPYRATSETKARFARAKETGLEGGIWRFIRENDRHWYQQVYWSPHFHVVGLCRDFAAGDSVEDDGWVVQNMSTGKGVEPNPGLDRRFSRMESLYESDAYEDLIGVIRYLLSHTPVNENRQSVTWFGDLHAVNFDPEVELSGGAWSTIQRRVDELVAGPSDRAGEEDGDDQEERECSVDGCEGRMHPIWEAQAFLREAGDDLPAYQHERLRRAYFWAIGDRGEEPRDGWPRSRTEDDARRALDALVRGTGIEPHAASYLK